MLVNSEEQHRLVAIDAGSYELGDPKSYSKGECNQQVARKIWKHAESCNAPYDYVKRLWQSRQSLPEAIAVLRQEWTRHPYLSRQKKTTAQIEQQMKGEVLPDTIAQMQPQLQCSHSDGSSPTTGSKTLQETVRTIGAAHRTAASERSGDVKRKQTLPAFPQHRALPAKLKRILDDGHQPPGHPVQKEMR